MSLTAASLLCQLAEGADRIDKVEDFTAILQQHIVQFFASPTPIQAQTLTQSHHQSATDASLASTEEERLLLVRSVYNLHTIGRRRHAVFFTSSTYHTNAALFIHELLGAVSGDRRRWFPRLRLEALGACVAVTESIGPYNARLCLPGIVSACAKYITLARHGTDPTAVRAAAVDLLHAALAAALAEPMDVAWLSEATVHLTRGSLAQMFAPEELAHEGLSCPVAEALQRLTNALLSLPAVHQRPAASFARILLDGHLVLSNIIWLLGDRNGKAQKGEGALEEAKEKDEWKEQKIREEALLTSLLQEQAVSDGIRDRLLELRGVALLHYASALLRDDRTRAIALHNPNICYTVLQRAVRFIGTALSSENLYSCRTPRAYPCGVVDEFLDCAAHAAVTTETCHQMMERFLDDCEVALADWDLYMLHPPIIYAAMRLVAWQFRPPHLAPGCPARRAATLVLSGPLERLWATVAQPHLWNTTTDSHLCSVQQFQHRAIVVATTLRGVEIIADIVRGAGVRAARRLAVMLLYVVLEKATAPAPVGDAAFAAVTAIAAANGHLDGRALLIAHADLIVDEAARAVAEPALRSAAAAVLRGGVALIRSDAAFEAETVAPIADFVAAAVRVASDSCRRAILESNNVNDDNMHNEDGKSHDDVTRAAAGLLTECFTIAATLNRSVLQVVANDEDDTERIAPAAEPRVQLLQHTILAALRTLMTHCTRADVVAPAAIRAIVSGIEAFGTTPAAEAVVEDDPCTAEGLVSTDTAREENNADINEPGKRGMQRVVPWDNQASSSPSSSSPPPPPPPPFLSPASVVTVLPRALLPIVYEAYLSFTAILREPLANVPLPSASRRRSAEERRALLCVRPLPAIGAALDGLVALFVMAPDFLARRIVDEVAPVVLAWYERGALPSIPTATDENICRAVVKFLRGVAAVDMNVGEETRKTCEALAPPAVAERLIIG